MKKIKTKIPQIRFPKFEDDWVKKNLSDICNYKNGKAHEQEIDSEGDFIVVNSKFISSKGTVRKYTDEQICPLYEGDVVMVLSDVPNGKALAKCYYIEANNKFTLNQRICALKSDKLNNKFLYYRIDRNRYFLMFDSGVGQTNLRKTDVLDCPLYIPPSIEEQEKIADFLSSADQKIQQLRRKKELLEEYKRGVMQKLFTREIRFKDENGEDYPDWEEYNVGKILKLFVTNSFSRNDLTYESGEVKNIHYGDIHSEFKMGFKVNEETVPYIVEEKKLSKYDEDQYVKPGDLIVADASEDYVDIGKAIEVLETGDERILAGLHTIHARDKKPLTVVGFKGYLFRSEAVRKQLKRVSQGASVLGISKGNFKEINVKLPCQAEQQKIVEFLQNIDKNITLVESKIEKFQIFKKGLLQKMFV